MLSGRTVTAISASSFAHTCAVADGLAFCWGVNKYGQLGNNSATDSGVPVAVDTVGALAGRTVTAVTAGNNHSCAVADGKAYCWGRNIYGRLGNDTTTDATVAGGGGHLRVLNGKTVDRDQRRGRRTLVRWPTGWLTAGVSTSARFAGCRRHVPECCSGTVHRDQRRHVSHLRGGGRAEPTAGASNGDGQLGHHRQRRWEHSAGGGGNLPGCCPVGPSPRSAPESLTRVRCADGQACCWSDNINEQFGTNGTSSSTVPAACSQAGDAAWAASYRGRRGGFRSCTIADGQGYRYRSNMSERVQVRQRRQRGCARAGAQFDTSRVCGRQSTMTAFSASSGHTAALYVATVASTTDRVTGVPRNGQVAGVVGRAGRMTAGRRSWSTLRPAVRGGATCTTVQHLMHGDRADQRHPLHVHRDGAATRSGGPRRRHRRCPSPPTTATSPSEGKGGKAQGPARAQSKITWKNPVTAATSYRVRISKPGGKKYKAWKTTSQAGVQGQGAQGQEVPLPSGRDRGRWPRAGHHDPVQGEVATEAIRGHRRAGFAGISCRTAHPAPPRDAHRQPVNTAEDARRTETGAAKQGYRPDQGKCGVGRRAGLTHCANSPKYLGG